MKRFYIAVIAMAITGWATPALSEPVVKPATKVAKPAVAKPAVAKPAKDVKATSKVTVKNPKVKVAPTSLPSSVPKDITGAVDLAKSTFRSGQAKNWWLMSAGIIWLIMFILKLLKLFKKMGRRWAYITVGVMSMAAMLLAKFGGGVSWEAAIAVLTSGPFMAFANDFVKRGILGKAHS